MASNESSGSVTARMKDLKDSVKERFLGLLGIRQPKVLLEDDEQEVFLQVGKTVWHAPRQLRVELWLSSLARRHSLVNDYQAYLSQDIAREASVDIDKDVQRTFPSTRRFHAEEGQTQLRNVLRAYAAYDPEVAYCQGMNFLTGLLLMYMPSEAHAFAGLVVLMEDRKLRSFYHRSMALLQVQLWQLSRLIPPSLNHHLEALGVVPMLYGASWLMTAFSADFPVPFSARIMDVLLADQCECALLKVAAALMLTVRKRLEEMSDLEEVLGYLKIEVPAWEEAELHDLLTAAFTRPWTARQLSILRSTEGAETVAQAMDRVMTMNEQLSAQACDDEDGGEEGAGGGGGGGDGEGRVAVTIPRLQPPPQPSNSFTTSPACGTPINGGLYGTGSHGGAGGSPPAVAAAAAAAAAAASGDKCNGGSSVVTGANSSGGDGYGLSGGGGGGSSGGNGAVLLLQGPASVSGSPATWAIPCIHPNVPASPAIQAFRRAHLPTFQAAVASSAVGVRNSSSCNGSLVHKQRHLPPVARNSCGGSLNVHCIGVEESTAADSDGGDGGGLGSPPGGCPSALRRGSDGCSPEDWGDFNTAAVRQQWRSLVRAPPGSTRHVLMHSSAAEEGINASAVADAPWRGAAGTPLMTSPSAVSLYGGALAAPPTPASRESSGGSATQPIPVPLSRSGSAGSGAAAIGSAFAAAAAAAAVAAGIPASSSSLSVGKPPLPPRCASSAERATGPPLTGLFSRLSVVAEDPPAVQMGPVAPAPSPRGSMDLYVLGRSGSQQLEGYEQQGLLLCGTSLGGGTGGIGSAAATGGDANSASYNADCVSGSATATTGCAMLSPTGISGAVSPHGLASPRVMTAWGALAGAGAAAVGGGGAVGGGSTGGAGSDTPTTGYMPLVLERAVSGSLLMDCTSGCGGGVIGGGGLSYIGERSFSLASPLRHASSQPPSGGEPPPAQQQPPPQPEQPAPSSDMATDIAGDILRMLSAVDTCNAHAAYDPRAVLGESMYADSPNKEEHKLVRTGSEHLRHLPSSSALAEMAAQDLARAQQEAERVRIELEAQLQQQRASERVSVAASGPEVAGHAASGTAAGGAGAALAYAPTPSLCATGAAASGVSEAPADVPVSAAVDGGASTAPAPVNGGGGDELVFKRPILYVDGIPMFDPKSLMADSQEAQIMFTPAVSPGASSYADPVLAGFTPTGDTAAAVDRDGAEGVGVNVESDAQEQFEDDKWDAVRSSEDGGEDEMTAGATVAEPTLLSRDGSNGGSHVPASATAAQPTLPAVAEVGALVAAREGGRDPVATATAASRCEADDVAVAALVSVAAEVAATMRAAAAGAQAAAEGLGGQLCSLPSASEWVDWSQAPPIQNSAAVGLPMSESATSAADEAAGATAPPSSEWASSCPPQPLRAAGEAGPAGEAGAAGEAGTELPPEPSPLMSTPRPTGPSSCLDHDLIDMASPARPLHPGVPSLVSQRTPLADSTTASSATGTGLSPGPPPPPFESVRQGSAASFSDLAAASGDVRPHAAANASTKPTMPYGLLPMTSSVTAAPPMAPTLSFASTAASAASAGSLIVRGSSFDGVPRSQLRSPSSPRCGSPGLYPRSHNADTEADGGAQAGKPAPVLHEEAALEGSALQPADGLASDCGGESGPGRNDNGGEDGPTEKVQEAWSPLRVPPPPPPPSSEGAVAAAADASAAGTSDKGLAGDGCYVPGLRVLAEVVSEPVPEQDAPLRWDLSPSGFGSEAPVEAGGGSCGNLDVDGQPQPQLQMPRLPQQQLPEALAMTAPGGGPQQQQQLGGGEAQGEDEEAKTPGPTAGGGRQGSWSSGLGGASYASGAASRGLLLDQQGSSEGDLEAGLPLGLAGMEEGAAVESSPFQAALSPSLAHHIMSAYLRSEQHQQQQELRELEEQRMQQQQQLQHEADQQQLLLQQQQQEEAIQQQQQHSLLSGSGVSTSQLEPAGTMEMQAGAGAPPPVVTPAAAAAGPSGGSGGAFGAVVAHLSVVDELGLCGVATVSGLTSPILGSPGRPGGGAVGGSAAAVSLQLQPHPTNAVHQQQSQAVAKALTPFALSLDDPTACRLSAEVLLSMPLQPLVLQPETPTPHGQLPGLCCIQGPEAGWQQQQQQQQGSGRMSLRCTGSGEGDGLAGNGIGGGVSCSAAGMLGAGGGSSNIARLSCGGTAPQLTLLGQGSHEGTCGNAVTAMTLTGATALVTAPMMPPVLALGSQVCGNGGMRVCGGSSVGGAVLPILAPPPPPQVPLCTASIRLEAATVPPPPASLPPLPLPPVLCSSSATVLCLADGGAEAAFTPVAGGACGGNGGSAAGAAAATGCGGATAFTQPIAPTWTATFDGVDDTPTSDTSMCGGPEPRVLSSAFAMEADTPPTRGSYSCGGGAVIGGASVGGAMSTTTGVSTPEARLHTPEIARVMEAAPSAHQYHHL